MTNLQTNNTDFDLEYHDVIKDPSDSGMQQIAETVPAKYKEKSVDDLINMHVNLEKVLHRQGTEVGQLRKLVDTQSQLLAASTRAGAVQPGQGTTVEPTTRAPITAEALLSRPDESLNQAVASNPSVTQNAQRLNQLEMNLARKDFEDKYSTYKEDVQKPEFQEWVLKSQTRSKLLVDLDRNYNFGSGKELWELWSEHTEAKDAADRAREQKVNAATTIRGSSSEVSQGTKPTLSRAKLAELQIRAERGDQVALARWNDPQFQNEYQTAYAEGRVK